VTPRIGRRGADSRGLKRLLSPGFSAARSNLPTLRFAAARRIVCVGAPPGACVGPARAEGEHADIRTE
jgi:hypothetical protein